MPEPSRPPLASPLAEISWGTLPLLALLSSAALGGLRLWPIRTEAVLRRVHGFLLGLLPEMPFKLGINLDAHRVFTSSKRVSSFFSQAVPSRQGMHQPQLSCA